MKRLQEKKFLVSAENSKASVGFFSHTIINFLFLFWNKSKTRAYFRYYSFHRYLEYCKQYTLKIWNNLIKCFGSSLLFLKIYLFIYRGREREGEKGQEKHRSVASHMPSAGDLTRTPGMYPNWELNLRPLSLRDDNQHNWA